MSQVTDSYANVTTFEDGDGSQLRVTRTGGHIVIRTSSGFSGFGGYVDLGPADKAALIQFLQGSDE